MNNNHMITWFFMLTAFIVSQLWLVGIYIIEKDLTGCVLWAVAYLILFFILAFFNLKEEKIKC